MKIGDIYINKKNRVTVQIINFKLAINDFTKYFCLDVPDGAIIIFRQIKESKNEFDTIGYYTKEDFEIEYDLLIPRNMIKEKLIGI